MKWKSKLPLFAAVLAGSGYGNVPMRIDPKHEICKMIARAKEEANSPALPEQYHVRGNDVLTILLVSVAFEDITVDEACNYWSEVERCFP